MQMPALNDTIVAVSSAWQAAPLGLVRLSGPDSFALLAQLGAAAPTPRTESARPQWTDTRLTLANVGVIPARVFWFHAPRSYTGQEVAEVHTVGCLPLLREFATRLIELGARRALPGEFTARAYRFGRLDTRQVEGVLALMQSGSEAAVRQAARLTRGSPSQRLERIVERLMQLLTLIEAGIDFADEEDVRFVTPTQVGSAIDELLADLEAPDDTDTHGRRAGLPHVALVGLPNAGKSTLFNALLGFERAIVSPVLGTTRDVLSAEIELEGLHFVLQDSAGLGGSADELELATHLATERAAEQADLVLWLHAVDSPWVARETEACLRVPLQRRLLVRTKQDLAGAAPADDAPVPFASTVSVSAAIGNGLATLRAQLAAQLGRLPPQSSELHGRGELRAAAVALRRAQALVADGTCDLTSAELIALDLRAAHDLLAGGTHGMVSEEVLGRIFAQFCVGK